MKPSLSALARIVARGAEAAPGPSSQESKEAAAERPSGPIARVAGAQAVGGGALAAFAPLAVALLSVTDAPSWTFILAIAAAAPLIGVAAVALARPLPPTAFAAAMAPLGLGALWFAWTTGGPFSPATPWIFAVAAGVAMMDARRGALFSALLAFGFGAALLALGDPPIRITIFNDLAERRLTAVLSWSAALFCLAATAWAALSAWTQALPPLRRPTIAARRALSLLIDDAAVAGLRISPAGVVIQALGSTERALALPRDELRGVDVKSLAHPDDLPELLAMLDAAGRVAARSARADAAAAAAAEASASEEAAETDADETEPPSPTPKMVDPKAPALRSATIRLRTSSGAYEWVEAIAAPARTYPEPPRMGAARGDALLIARARWRAGSAPGAEMSTGDSALLAQVNSHLRGSIKSIHGYTEILANEIFGPIGGERYREYARLAHDDAAKLLGLVDELLDLAEIEAGRFVANAELIDPVPLIDGAVRNLTQTAERLGVRLVPEFPPNAPYLRVDRRALRRALSGLVLDGLRRAEIGDQVALRIDPEDGALRFSVVVTRRQERVSASDAPRIAAPTHPSGASDNAQPREGAPIENRDSVRAAARLSRLVARSLIERMNGAIFIAPDADAPTPERSLTASEAIFETPRSVSAPPEAGGRPRLLPAQGADPVSFAPDDEEARAAAARARAAEAAAAEQVDRPLFSDAPVKPEPAEPQPETPSAPQPQAKAES